MLRPRLATLEEMRAHAEPLPRGSAPYTSSNVFKTQRPGPIPKAKLWDHRFSLECLGQNASSLKAAARTLNQSSMISLATARPSPQYYPWESITLRGLETGTGKDGIVFDSATSVSCKKGEEAYDLSVALNYGYGGGSPQVLRFITEHVELVHNPPYDDWESCLTCGTTSAVEIALRIFCNRGDWILAEGYTYAGTVDAAKAQGLNVQGVKMDDFGLLPEDLDLTLRTWDETRGRKPFVLYTIPSGQNPTGTTQSTQRRKTIYEVAEKHDLYIIEDDPYYFLQLGYGLHDSPVEETVLDPADGYLQQLPASYLSLDVSGRVLRLDTTSKILAPGLRCGWMTACSQVVQKFLAHTEVSTVSPSGPSQIMVFKLLEETWGHEGFINWLSHLSLQYRQRRDVLVTACDRHLPSEVCHWTVPKVGMFLWIRLDLSKHPSAQPDRSLQDVREFHLDVEENIHAKAKENGVLVTKGSWFTAETEKPLEVCFRTTFAAAPEHALGQAVKLFGDAVRAEFALQ